MAFNDPGVIVMASSGVLSPTNKRQLTRRYKQSLRPMGVYAIRNLADARVFVGGSLDLDGAMNRHRFELEMKGHRNRRLLRDWMRLGAAQFRFETIDTLKERDDPAFDYRSELESLLEMWRDELGAYGENGYNIRSTATAGGRP